jgi:hypothetical protein
LRVLSAAAFVVLGGLVIVIGFLLALATNQRWVARGSIAAGAVVCGIGFAIYDYRGPFGPRPSSRCGR